MKKLEIENDLISESDLTVEEFRQNKEYHCFTDDQVKEIIDFLKTYRYLVYQAHRKINSCEEENEMIIDLHKNTELKIAA